MAYAISFAAVAAAILIYLLSMRKLKPKYYRDLGEDIFFEEAKKLVTSLPIPKKCAQISAARYLFCIKRDIFLLKRKRVGGEFDDMIISKDQLKKLSDASKALSLPAIDDSARMVILAKFCLENSGGKADMRRIGGVLEEQNKWRTLTFTEIAGAKQAFKFALLTELASLYEKLLSVTKAYSVAKQYVASPATSGGKIEGFKNSTLFLSLCAKAAGYKAETYSLAYSKLIAGFKSEFDMIMRSAKIIDEADMSSYYSPLEIYDKYEIFSSAGKDTKRNFLNLASEISDRENIDEFLFAIRVDKYMHSASSGHMAIKRFKIGGNNFCMIRQKRNISLLGAALSSHYFMDVYFRPVSGRFFNRSITKILEYENSFEPIYKFKCVNFGISIKDGKLRLSPRLPEGVICADVKFAHMGTEHTLHLKKGDEEALYLCGSRINGVSGIALGSRPLDITLVIDDGKSEKL